MSKGELTSFSVQCPCCQSELVIDAETRTVLHHTPLAAAPPITDLAAEVRRLRMAGAEREIAFQRSLESEKSKEQRMDRKFDELLRRAKQTPAAKPVKDIDL
jgi:hypothetical protein